MRFLGSNFTQNALAAGAPPRTPLPLPLGELNRSPRPLADFRGQGKGKGGERGRRERGYWGGKEGAKGREEGTERKGKVEGKGGEGEFASLALGGIDAPG